MNKEKIKQYVINEYCFDLAIKIVGSNFCEANRVADILHKEFKNNKLTLKKLSYLIK